MQPGASLGHYQILAAIGKGGMGEVWKAHGRTRRREVAIKTLPEEFAPLMIAPAAVWCNAC
jgi:serine/threonine protein kinase